MNSSPIARLSAISPLGSEARGIIADAMLFPRLYRSRHLIDIDNEHARPLLIIDGWAARWRQSRGGTRQLLNLILPGDVLWPVDHGAPPVIAITDVTACLAPVKEADAKLGMAFQRSKQLDQSYLYSQIARLGSMGAQERLIDMTAEIYERLSLAGLVTDQRFDMPLSQAVLAELLAMTPVHANRMLAAIRRGSNEMRWTRTSVEIVPGGEIDARVKRNLATISQPENKTRRV